MKVVEFKPCASGRVLGSLLERMNLQALDQCQVSVLVLAPGAAASTDTEDQALLCW